MKPDPVKLLEEALKLSPEARAALAASLLESLEEGVDEDGGCLGSGDRQADSRARFRGGRSSALG
jgi:hypothetical protein